ncbi:MAG: hypothetical protein ABIF01_05320 [Candidatus Micrarchaeota archaeon]
MKLASHIKAGQIGTSASPDQKTGERGKRAIDSSQETARIWLATFQNEINNSLGVVPGKFDLLLHKLKRSGLDEAGEKELSLDLKALGVLLNALQQHVESFKGKQLPENLKPLLIEGKSDREIAALVCEEAGVRVEAAISRIGELIGKFRERGADTQKAESEFKLQAGHIRNFVSMGKEAASTGDFKVVEHAHDNRFIVEFGPAGGFRGRSEKL